MYDDCRSGSRGGVTAEEPESAGTGATPALPPSATRSYNIYYVYADADEGSLQGLERHLHLLERQKLLRGWHRRKVLAGEDWQTAVDQHFEDADIIVLLVSPDLLDSKYCYDTEVERAMRRHLKGEVVVVPVLVRPCMWELTPFERCRPLPGNAVPVSLWEEPESALLDIAKGIHDLLLGLRGSRAQGGQRAPLVAPASDRDVMRERVDRLEVLLSRLPSASGDLAKVNELREEIAALDHLVRPLLTPKAGDVVGGMELVHPVGSGAFATVWLSKPPGIDAGERFATKVLHATCLTAGSMLWRFRRGVKAMKYLTQRKDPHPQIVPLLREADHSLAFSMPYLPNQNLVNVKERGWSVEKKVEVLISICRAVEYAHKKGVVHRDIKPANIVFDAAGTPFLTDFDIADMEYATTVPVDERGLGSPMFAAPEQIEQGGKPDVRFDVYSLGRLLHYLLLERPISVAAEHPADFAGLSKCPLALASIVRKATRRDPSRRYRDVASFRSALEVYRSPSSLLSAWVDAMGGRLRPWIALVAVVLLGAAAGVAFVRYDRYREAQLRALTDEITRLRAYYVDLAREKATYSDERRELEAQMEALVREYNKYAEDEALSPADKDALNQRILAEWLPLKAKHDDIPRKEALLAEKVNEQVAKIEETQRQLEEERRRRGLKPLVWPRLNPPAPSRSAVVEPPEVEVEPTNRPTASRPEPKPLTFTDFSPALARAKEQAYARCRAPSGAERKIMLVVALHPTGEVYVKMVTGPIGTGAELCVLGPYQRLRVQPFEGSVFEQSQNFTIKGED
jgi:hypothetical protein